MRRVLLKISGEALSGKLDFGIDNSVLDYIGGEIAKVHNKVEIALVIGGGNIFRGIRGINSIKINRTTADSMGMLATCMNALAVRDSLLEKGVHTRILGAFEIGGMFEKFEASKANHLMRTNKNVIIITGGTSNPFFTTDTAAVLRALEIKADIVLKATNVHGVYDKDPNKHKDAVKYDELTFKEAIDKNLKVMDLTAFSMAMDNNMPIRVFNMNIEGNISRVLLNENIGTLVHL